MLPNETFNVIELAKIESAITGIIAGFALTIVVLLIERLASRPDDKTYDSTLGQSAIVLFITVFFTSILGSYLLATVAGEAQNSVRAYLLLLPAAFVFALSTVLLMLGLVVLLAAYKLTYVLGPTRIVFYATFVLALSHYADSTQDVIVFMHGNTGVYVPSDATLALMLLGIPVVTLLTSIGIRQRRKRLGKTYVMASGFQTFTKASLLASVGVGLLTMPILDASPMVVLPIWQVLLYPIALAVLVAWSAFYIPAVSE